MIGVGFVYSLDMEQKAADFASDESIAPFVGSLQDAIAWQAQAVVLIGTDGWAKQQVLAARVLSGDVSVVVCRQSEGSQGSCELLDCGADYCLPPACSAAEVSATVRALGRRRAPDRRGEPDVRLEPSSRILQIRSFRFRFGPTAFLIVRYLVEHRNRWVSQQELVERAIGTPYYPDCTLARVHVHQIRRQLGSLGHCIKRSPRNGGGYYFSLNELDCTVAE